MSKTTKKEKSEKKKKILKEHKYKNFKQFLEEETAVDTIDFKIKGVK